MLYKLAVASLLPACALGYSPAVMHHHRHIALARVPTAAIVATNHQAIDCEMYK